MNATFDFGQFGKDLVYVKAVDVATLPQEVQERAGTLTTLFAVHDAEGTQLALVSDRRMAFVLARQHDKVPLTVH